MSHPQYDLTIIGAGSGGITAARIATALGAKVLLIDRQRLGGDCLNYGCVPSKSLIHVARLVQQAKDASRFGLMPPEMDIDMARVSTYIQDVINRVAANEQKQLEGVTIKFGHVSFISPTQLRIDDEEFTSRNTIIATGSYPATPPIDGLQEVGYLTNEDVFNLTQLPQALAIVGGGPIGVELAQAFERLGAKVTIVEGLARILTREDPEVSAAMTDILQREGIDIYTSARFVKAERHAAKKVIIAQQGEKLLNIEADEIILALGRRPNVAGLNLEAARVRYDDKGITVDEHLQTSTPNILAIGDVIGGYLFTHVAAYHARVAVRNALLPIGKQKVDYRVVPWCTFTDPEVARIGLTSAEAEQQYTQTHVVKFPWAEIDRAQTEGETAGFIKLVLAGKKEEIVGAHLVGARAGELLGELALAMQHRLTLKDIRATIHAYPTISTGIQQTTFEAYLESPAATSNRKVVRAALRLRGRF